MPEHIACLSSAPAAPPLGQTARRQHLNAHAHAPTAFGRRCVLQSIRTARRSGCPKLPYYWLDADGRWARCRSASGPQVDLFVTAHVAVLHMTGCRTAAPRHTSNERP
eukprot:TRINITY_DN76334_c0_g1_i1.p2 TRINITY_DN76334_c0_g1~~TRINITY_DN76334_c0_g1_i1.p2  ORF type:complete len:108 (+),score=18.70 TRINITY_DN76334_c0_g1_i1:910-1233(+)